MGKASKTPVRVKVWVTGQPLRRRSSRLSSLLTIAMIGGAIATAAGGIWLALRLIVDPGSVSWVQQIIPGWQPQLLTAKIWQTWDEIAIEAATAGLQTGDPIYFSTYPELPKNSEAFHEFLLPIYRAKADCQLTGTAPSQMCPLVELRVYRPQTNALRLPGKPLALELVDRLHLSGPEELLAVAPLVNADIVEQGSSRKLPLTVVSFVGGHAPLPGIWLHVSGKWQRGSSRTLYGQMVRYDPGHDRLQSLLTWTSPSEQFPAWQQVTGGDATELVVDQTLGLEPQFQVYQFAALSTPGQSVQVKAIDLREATLDNRAYANGLLLARHGLWSMALQVLQQSKTTAAHWSATAQAQMDLVALHANVTQTQADRDWASPGQQISTLLIDGRWSQALAVLQTAHANGYTTSTLLADHSDRLWNRVSTAVRVNPQPDLMSWGVLLAAARQDRTAALAWLQKQTRRDRQAEQILALLDPLPSPTVAVAPSSPLPSVSPTVATTVPVSTSSTFVSPSSRIIGSAVLQGAIETSDWLRPDRSTLTVASDQNWYEIRVIGFQDGLQWRQQTLPDLTSTDSTEIAETLWHRLGLDQDANLQLITWTAPSQPQVRQVTARAIRVADGAVWLLATGELDAGLAANPSLLAMTLTTLSWVEPLSVSTLDVLSQQPQWTNLLPALWHELQQSPELLPPSVIDAATLLQEFGGWSVQLMELTADDQPEVVLTLQTDLPPDRPATQTLIFSSRDGLLYSDLSQTGRSLKAMADLGDGKPPALIISTTQDYRLQRWSARNRQFE